VQHGDAGADVAQAEREVDVAVDVLDARVAAFDADKVAVGEPDLLRGVVEARVDE